MKVLAVLAIGAISVFGNVAVASPVKTTVTDTAGTTFVVAVDWDARIVSARLKANPAGLQGNQLWAAMQKAVYYGSAVDCGLDESSASFRRPNEVVGTLHCPWFDRVPSAGS